MVAIPAFQHNKKIHRNIYLITLSVLVLLIALKPKEFINLWLTKDQQAQLLFNHGDYLQASKTFSDIHWQAFSAYAHEDYETAAMLYGQFNDKKSLLAQANALAHSRHYIKARDLYQSIINQHPNYPAAKQNIAIVQAIIDEVNLLSQAQQAEQGESIKELGDEPQTGDGAEKKQPVQQKVEQLNSAELLLDPKLNEMWLRQVQKDPGKFLSQKFYFQQEQAKENTGRKNAP